MLNFDWIDKYCDLTLSTLLETLDLKQNNRLLTPENMVKPIED